MQVKLLIALNVVIFHFCVEPKYWLSMYELHQLETFYCELNKLLR